MYCEFIISIIAEFWLSIWDKYCASHAITFNIKKSECKFCNNSVNKHCKYTNVYSSGNQIELVQVKYLGALLISLMKTSIDVSRQTRELDATAQLLLLW